MFNIKRALVSGLLVASFAITPFGMTGLMAADTRSLPVRNVALDEDDYPFQDVDPTPTDIQKAPMDVQQTDSNSNGKVEQSPEPETEPIDIELTDARFSFGVYGGRPYYYSSPYYYGYGRPYYYSSPYYYGYGRPYYRHYYYYPNRPYWYHHRW